MNALGFRLRHMSVTLRLACTCVLLVLGGGYLASVQHLINHYENKDERAGLTMDDIIGSFHGVKNEATLIRALSSHMKPHLSEEERGALLQWLQGSRISEDYDNFDLGDKAPAEIIDRNCKRCHSRNATEGEGIGTRLPLEYWDDVKPHAFSKQIDPVPVNILTLSTHTHASSMALIALATAILFLATAWPRRLKSVIIFLTCFGLLADVGSWWLTRWEPSFAYVIVISGAVYGALLGLQWLLTFLDMWFGRRSAT
ncbi:MAG: hypothetical protein AB1486_25280 [Planctomycetota bacterium]